MNSVVYNSQLFMVLVSCAYVGSGICQPLLMQVCKQAGLADSNAQLYMLAYYAGPASLLLVLQPRKEENFTADHYSRFPPILLMKKATMIAIFDIFAQTLNYNGAVLSGATIFSVIYSSVTIWTAVFSYTFLKRSMSWVKWIAVLIVFGGLCITASNSMTLGPAVFRGTVLVLIGSCLHGGTYVLSEAIMIGPEQLSPIENSTIQGLVACIALSLWQIIYTVPNWDSLIAAPMKVAGTSITTAIAIMLSFALINLVHSIGFFQVLKHSKYGATTAGVLKGLQAVLVFVLAHFLFCNKNLVGHEMCFSRPKFVSLITVIGGVLLFGVAKNHNTQGTKPGYSPINNTANLLDESSIEVGHEI